MKSSLKVGAGYRLRQTSWDSISLGEALVAVRRQAPSTAYAQAVAFGGKIGLIHWLVPVGPVRLSVGGVPAPHTVH